MDHWGDPWADNANDKSPTKSAATSPLPPAFSFTAVPVSGFADDAGWGDNDDGEFGDWAANDAGNGPTVAGAGAGAGLGTRGADDAHDSAGWGVTREQNEEWPEIVSPMPRVLEKVDSEPSDSSTVAQLEEAIRQHEDDDGTEGSTPTPRAELDASERSSTSPSETSRNDVPVESPRTSIEDDQAVKQNEQETTVLPAELDVEINDKDTVSQEEEGDTTLEDAEGTNDGKEPAESSADRSEESLEEPPLDSREYGDSSKQDSASVETTKNSLQLNTTPADLSHEKALMAQLFPPDEKPTKQLEEHGDPIFSTSARKAWYRLTRKQTMREFNHGENDDNYVRVAWTNSNIRNEVNKVVSRWAREDRISGTGPGARASFYWDSPAPAEARAPFAHSRTQSSVPTTKTALPARQSLPPLATGQPAAFDWTYPASADPWKIDASAPRSTSSPLALKNPTVAKLQRQEGRAVSVDLTPRKPEQTAHKRTATVSHLAPETETVSTPTTQPSAEASDPWASLETSDSASTTAVEVGDTHNDDDDDWGEMVQTPTLPSPHQLDPFSNAPTTRNNLPPPPLPKPTPPITTPIQAEPTEPMSASPIVRLQSTISPTSALFKANAFVPLHAEQGPIGPGLLKPANRASRSTTDKKLEIDTAVPHKAAISVAPAASPAKENGSKEILAFLDASGPVTPPPEFEEVSIAPAPATNPTPPPQSATPVQAPEDAWGDADFSIFESALPVTAPPQPSQPHDPSDPFSFFDNPAPTPTRPQSKSFSRSPPRNTTPPSLQPLSSATGSSQRRKAEEDYVIADILDGLPDLSYMLRV